MWTTSLHDSKAETATGTGAGVDTAVGSEAFHPTARVYLDVSAVTGSPTLDVDIYGTVNGVDVKLGTIPQQTAVGQATLELTSCPKTLKAKWTIGGTTPSVTFSLACTRWVA